MAKNKESWQEFENNEKRNDFLLKMNHSRMMGTDLVTREDIKLLTDYWDVLDETLPASHALDLFKKLKKNNVLNENIIFENIMQSSNFALFSDYFKYFNLGIDFDEPRDVFWNDEKSVMLNSLDWWCEEKGYEGIYSIFSQVCPHPPQSTITMCSINPENMNETSWLSLALNKNEVRSIEDLYPLEVPDVSTPEGVEKRAQLLVNLLQSECPFFVFEKNKEYLEDIFQPEVLQQFLTLNPEVIYDMESSHVQRRMTDMMNVLLSAMSMDTQETSDEAIKKTIINCLPAIKDKNDLKYRVVEVLFNRISKGSLFTDPDFEEKIYSMISVKSYGVDRDFRDLLTASTHLFLQSPCHIIADENRFNYFLKNVPNWIKDTSSPIVKKLFTSSLISNFMTFNHFNVNSAKPLEPVFIALKGTINISTVFETGSLVVREIKEAFDDSKQKQSSENLSKKIRKIDHSLYCLVLLKPLFQEVLPRESKEAFDNYYGVVNKAWRGIDEKWKNNTNDSDMLKNADMFFKELVVSLEMLHKVDVKPKVQSPSLRF